MTPKDLSPFPTLPAAGPLRPLILLALCGLPVAAAGGLALSGGLIGGAALSALVFAVMAGLAVRGMALAYPHDRMGSCNAVTLLRAALAAAVAAPLAGQGALAAAPGLAWSVLAVAALALALDGLDGWLARRSGLTSEFGARFDMEVDSALALILAGLALANGKAGLWVLALGALRYAWVAAGLILPWLQGALPQRFRRKAVCVVQIAALILLLAPPLVPPVSTVLGLAATALLVWSFALDLLWLARRR
jgi:phosphatidylglycerophosphate synthase